MVDIMLLCMLPVSHLCTCAVFIDYDMLTCSLPQKSYLVKKCASVSATDKYTRHSFSTCNSAVHRHHSR